MERKKRRSHHAEDFERKPEGEFDKKLNLAIENIKKTVPDDWHTVLSYLRSKTIAVRVNAEDTETVKAEYHRKAQVVQLVNKLQGFEGE